MNDYNSLSEEEQIKIVNENGYNIKNINNPSEKVQLAAVNKNPPAIEYIENPSEKLQLAAVKQNPVVIIYIENPSEKVELMALENKWSKRFYNLCIGESSNKTDWFCREFNRLKLTKGPLK